MNDFLMWAGGLIIGGIFEIIRRVFADIRSELKKLWENDDKMKERLHEKVNDLETRFEAHRLYAAETFSTKIDVERGFDRVINKLNSIDEKLDRKADKKA